MFMNGGYRSPIGVKLSGVKVPYVSMIFTNGGLMGTLSRGSYAKILVIFCFLIFIFRFTFVKKIFVGVLFMLCVCVCVQSNILIFFHN